MKLNAKAAALVGLFAATALTCASAILVQPHNYLLDDSSLVDQPDLGSLSPYYNDQGGSSEQSADKDIVGIIGERLARLSYARMLDSQQQQQQDERDQASQLSQEMAELLQAEQQADGGKQEASQEQPLSVSSVASMLLSAAQAAAQAQSAADEAANQAAPAGKQASSQESRQQGSESGARAGPIMELDTSPGAQASSAQPNKADLKSGTSSQWFNPKETIPVLKISSMGKFRARPPTRPRGPLSVGLGPARLKSAPLCSLGRLLTGLAAQQAGARC